MSKTPNILSKRPQQLRKRQEKPWDEFSLIPSCRMRPVCFHFHFSSSSVFHLTITCALEAAADNDFVAFQIVSPRCCRRGQKNSLQTVGTSCLSEGSPFKFRWNNHDNNQCDCAAKNNLFQHRITFVSAILYLFLDVWIPGLTLRLFSQQSWCL